MADHKVKIVVQVDATDAVSALQNVSKGMTQVAQSAKGTSSTAIAAGVAMGTMFADLAEKALAMSTKIVTGFTDMANEVYRMQIVMGGTAQDMSKLRFAAEMVGVSTEDMTRAFMFASNHLADNDKAAKAMGISYLDLNGNVKPTMQLFGEMADRLKAIEDPIQRANLARDVFGRGVRAMEPMLALGSEGLNKFAAQAQELGIVLDGKDVEASRNFHASVVVLESSMQAIGNEIGRTLVPILAGLAQAVAGVFGWFKKLFDQSNTVKWVLLVLAGSIGLVTTALVVYTAAQKIATLAKLAWDAAQAVDPMYWVAVAIIAVIAAVIALIKNFKVAGDVMVTVGKVIGWVVGHAISYAINGFRLLGDAVLNATDAILMGIGWLASLGDTIAGWLGFDTTWKKSIDGARNAIKSAHSTMDDAMSSWADDAYKKGSDVGASLMRGLVNAIKNLHMPSLGELVPPMDTQPGPVAGDPSFGGGGSGKALIDARKQAILDFFSNLVKQSYAALEALKAAAVDAQKKMKDLGKSIADTLNEAFSLSAVSGATFARYTGPGALIRGYESRLQQMKDFVSDIKSLASMGLPKEMLADLISAGVTNGAATAHMLVGHPEVMQQLQSLQNEINVQTVSAGTFASEAIMGSEVETARSAAFAYQSQYRGYLGAAQQIGYTPTEQELAAAGDSYLQEITINATTMASPQDIAAAVAWALATGVGLGMTPAGTPSGGGGVSRSGHAQVAQLPSYVSRAPAGMTTGH